MDSDGKYYYFDQDGMVVDVEEAPVDGIPLVDGLRIRKNLSFTTN